MADLFNVASSALLSYRRALDTVGHNIANVNTPGYSRQQVELAARSGVASGGGFYGGGVAAISVDRLQDPFAADRLLGSLSAAGQGRITADFSGRIDRMLSDEASGLAEPLRNFLGAVDGVAADPSSIEARQVMLSSADSLAVRFRQLSDRLDSQAGEVEQRIGTTVSSINTLSGEIARVNANIIRASGASAGQAPNDLLDQRDELVRQLADKVGISTVLQDDGALNVFAADGQALVLGNDAAQLAVTQGGFGPGNAEIVLAGSGVTLSRHLSGGELGGLLASRDEIMAPARAELGRLAVAVAAIANQGQAAGVDLAGQVGAALFSTAVPVVRTHTNNLGNAAIAAGVADPAALTGRDYDLRFDGSNWQLRESGGASISLAGSGTPGDPFTAAGLSLVVSGTAQAGDSFRIRSTGGAAGNLSLTLNDPAGIAAAGRLEVQTASANTGLTTASLAISDTSNPALATATEVVFTTAGSYTLNGAGPFPWTPGDTVDHNGWELTLDGQPAVGDRFSVAGTAANSGDNGNARDLIAALQSGFFDGGATSLQAANAQAVSRAGVAAQRAELQSSAAAAIAESDLTRLESVSGVNLDEEAADLLRYEQAYQAAARVIATAESMFQSLLAAVGR